MVRIRPIRAFTDNYIWSLDDGHSAVIVDPGDSAPVLEALAEWQLQLKAILLTHHHFDHVGGVPDLVAKADIPVMGPSGCSPHLSRNLAEGDTFTLLGLNFSVTAVPGHTLDHIALYTGDMSPPALFCGDTLFAGGCGRLFEGSPEQMYQSLGKLTRLPMDTRVYCAHEYTQANLRFAMAVEPGNEALQTRQRSVDALRAEDKPTVPSSLADEMATNPFLRSERQAVRDAAAGYAKLSTLSPAETFAAVRRWKDEF